MTTELIIETGKNIYGADFQFVRLGLVKGRNLFVKNGWTVCPNKLYVSNGTKHFNYCRALGCWVDL